VDIFQRHLFTLYPFLDVKGKASVPPSLPVGSEQPVAINSCTPVMDSSYQVLVMATSATMSL